MGAVTKIESVTPSSGYAAYERERAYSRKLEHYLDSALTLLGMETHRRKLLGEDVAHLEAFVAEARRAAL